MKNIVTKLLLLTLCFTTISQVTASERNDAVSSEYTSDDEHTSDGEWYQHAFEDEDESQETCAAPLLQMIPCNHCSKMFQYQINLKDTDEQTYICNQCEEEYRAANILNSFKNIGSDAKLSDTIPYTCDECGKSFKNNKNLKRHALKMHSVEKTAVPPCPDNSLKAHLALHACEHCNKSFKSFNDLERHLRVHTGERPYTCPNCAKPFSDKSAFLKHTRTHVRDNERPSFSCNLCSASYSRIDNLNYHKKNKHPVEYNLQITQKHQKALELAVAQAAARATKNMLKGKTMAELQSTLPLAAEEEVEEEAEEEEVAEINKQLGIPAPVQTQQPLTEYWQQSFACNFCDKKFRVKEYLEGHIAANHLNKKYKCATCNSFSTNALPAIEKHELGCSKTGPKNSSTDH